MSKLKSIFAKIKYGVGKGLGFALPIARTAVKLRYKEEYALAVAALPRLEKLAKDQTEWEIDDKAVSLISWLLVGKKKG